jgi:hypothetical protein
MDALLNILFVIAAIAIVIGLALAIPEDSRDHQRLQIRDSLDGIVPNTNVSSGPITPIRRPAPHVRSLPKPRSVWPPALPAPEDGRLTTTEATENSSWS